MYKYHKLKDLRNQKKLSQEQFLISIHRKGLTISRTTLSSWENGATFPKLDQLQIIAEYFDKPIIHFFK